MMRLFFVIAALTAATVPALASIADLEPIACPTRHDLYKLLNAADRRDAKATARLVGPVCQKLAGLRYSVEEDMNGVSTVRVFVKEGDWATSQLAYTLDEMVTPE